MRCVNFSEQRTPWIVAFILALLLVGSYQVLFAAPASFIPGSVVTVVRGTSAPLIAEQLANAHIIKHPLFLRVLLRLSGTSDSIHAGMYRFEKSQNIFSVTFRLATGAYGLPPVQITFPEGITVREVAAKISEALPGIRKQDFLEEAKKYEGYLFPDTYLFPPSSDTESIIAAMRANFNTKIATLESEIQSSGRSFSDVVIMASLIEREARLDVSKRMVAGILFNRLKLGMPLQVDAVFGYIFDRATYSPSYADLTVDSPYNTYTHKGLPPGPISNPGLSSLESVLNPTKTNYLYYLTGKDGLMHYATTYTAHQANRKKYLD